FRTVLLEQCYDFVVRNPRKWDRHFRDLSMLEKVSVPFPRISYDEAVALLQKHGSEIQWGSDFGGGDETIISQQFDKPVMVHRYPTAVKAFYMEPDPARPEVALCVDVLAPEGYGEI